MVQEMITIMGSLLTLSAAAVGIGLYIDHRTRVKDGEFLRHVGISEVMDGQTAVLPVIHDPLPGTYEIIPAPNDMPCPDCTGKRCYVWRDSGHQTGCDDRPSPGNSYVAVEETVAGKIGRHTPRAALRRWVDAAWSPLSIDTRVFLAPSVWARRLPVLIPR